MQEVETMMLTDARGEVVKVPCLSPEIERVYDNGTTYLISQYIGESGIVISLEKYAPLAALARARKMLIRRRAHATI